MKIAKQKLLPGDSLDLSVTHEIVISGEKSWVKYGAATTIQQGESEEDARARLSAAVNEGVMRSVHETVDKVRSST